MRGQFIDFLLETERINDTPNESAGNHREPEELPSSYSRSAPKFIDVGPTCKSRFEAKELL
jgi:hypothetical protein